MNRKNYLLGISIGYSKVQAVIISQSGETISSREQVFKRGDDPVPEAVKAAGNLLKEKGDGADITAAGVAFPGLVDSRKGIVLSSLYFPEFHNRPVAEEFETALGLRIPFHVEKAAECSLMYWRKVLSEDEHPDAFLISLDPGVSAAVYSDDLEYDEETDSLSELGHIAVTGNTLPCICGKKGCLETLVGEAAWSREFRKISKLPNAEKDFRKSVEHGMPEALQLLSGSLTHLLYSASPLLDIFYPEHLLFHAPLPPSSVLVISTIMEELGFINGDPRVELLDEYAPAYGAALTAFTENQTFPHP